MTHLADWLKQHTLILTALAIVFIAYFAIPYIHPTFGLLADSDPYPWFMWVCTLSIIFLPVVFFCTTPTFKSASLWDKALWVSVALVLVSLVHQLRVTIDVQWILFVVAILYFFHTRPHIPFKPTMLWILLAYWIWMGISIWWSSDRAFGFDLWTKLIPLITYPFFLSLFRLPKDAIFALLKVFWQACVLATMLTLVSGIYETHVLGIPFLNLFTTKKTFFGEEIFCYNILYGWKGQPHPSYNALWLIVGEITALYLRIRNRLSWTNCVLSIVLFTSVILLTQSRIGIVLLIICIVLAILHYLRFKPVGLVTCIIGGALCTGALLWFVPYFPNTFYDEVRDNLWQGSMAFLHHYWKWGCGLGGITNVTMSAVKPDFPYLMYEHIYPHNQFLGDWMHAGVPGLVLLLGLIITYTIRVIRQHSYMGISFMVIVLLFMWIEMPFYILQGTTIISFFATFIVLHQPSDDIIPDTSPCVDSN